MNAHHALIYGSLDAPSTLSSDYQSKISGQPTQTLEEKKEGSKTQIIGQTSTGGIQQKSSLGSVSTNPDSLNNPNKRKKKILRKAAGKQWEDPTLEEWPDNDYRIFCGDLGNEVNDDVLANAFKKYQSFVKARVVRDKVTLKSKGFGFVSIMNQDDYIKAMREMNGKYVGNRPIKLKKSDWQDKSASCGGPKKKSLNDFGLLGKRK